MQTLEQFIKSAGAVMTATSRDDNHNFAVGEKNRAAMHHWTCLLRCGRSRMTIPFSMGSALTREPTVAEVLDCLASDASGIENARSFEDWCGEYGYDVDSRKAEKTFKVCQRQANQLKRFLGDSAYATLLWEVERA